MNKGFARILLFACSLILLFSAAHLSLSSDNSDVPPSGRGTWIDVHQHLWGTVGPQLMNNRGDLGSTPGMEPSESRGTDPGGQSQIRPGKRATGMSKKEGYLAAAKNLISLQDRYGLERSMLMPPPRTFSNQDVEELDCLDAVMKEYPHRFYLVAGGGELNPMIQKYGPSQVTEAIKREFRKNAENLIKKGIKAFGEMAGLHLSFSKEHVFEESLPDHPLFLELADLSAQHGIPIDLHLQAVLKDMPIPAGFKGNNPDTLRANIGALENLLRHNRKARIVWLHAGWDNTGDKSPSLIRRLLEENPNLYCSLRIEERTRALDGSAMPNRVVDENWKITDEWMKLFTDYPERFMIGADEFIGIPGVSKRAPQSFEETWRILDQLPDHLARKIGRDNAVRIYGLD